MLADDVVVALAAGVITAGHLRSLQAWRQAGLVDDGDVRDALAVVGELDPDLFVEMVAASLE